jgi:hypothetical protein
MEESGSNTANWDDNNIQYYVLVVAACSTTNAFVRNNLK